MTDTVRRAVLIVGVLAVLVGIAIADPGGGNASGGSGAQSSAPQSSAPQSSGAPSSAQSSSSGGHEIPPATDSAVSAGGVESSAWFCAGGSDAGGNVAALLLSNPTAKAVAGTVTTVSTTTAPSATPVLVPAGGEIGVLAPAGTSSALASTVVFSGGGVGVTQVGSGPLGYSAGPCAATTAAQWYFADGSTASGDTLALSLFNPTDTVAVVDVSFVSSSGVVAPPAYQGIDVPGDSLVVENVGDHVMNDPHVATTVTSLSGAVVAAERQSAGSAGDGGSSVVLGATRPSTMWSFAQNTDLATGQTVFHVFNPSSEPARVTVRIGLEQGAAEPLVLRVPAGSVSTLDAQRVTRIPAGIPFAASFVSADGVGIVVDRHVSSPTNTPPAGGSVPVVGDVAGVAGGADRWLLPPVSAPATGVSALAVVNLGSAPVSVRLFIASGGRLVAVAAFGNRRVRPGTPLVVAPALKLPIGTVPLELVAGGPVAVELDPVPVGSPGVVVLPALPLR